MLRGRAVLQEAVQSLTVQFQTAASGSGNPGCEDVKTEFFLN